MISRAKNKYVRISPYKLRPIVNLIRGCSVEKAVSWLKAHSTRRAQPIIKTVLSAYSNAKNSSSDVTSMDGVFIKEVRVDQGPSVTYFKPGAMGRANMQQKKMCHVMVGLDFVKNKTRIT
jgi:large subunit ribosomal protein L22